MNYIDGVAYDNITTSINKPIYNQGLYGTIMAGTATSKDSIIERIDFLNVQIDDVFAVLGRLDQRLNPVLSMSVPIPADPKANNINATTDSSVYNKIAGISTRLTEIRTLVDSITDRVQL